MNRLILCLQFHNADRVTALRLARLCADIEAAPRQDVEFIFVARYDTDHDHDTIRYVGQKFPVHWITTHTRWTGWPAGCNAVAKDALEWIAANRKDALGVLMIEPDCVPAKLNWLDILIAEWRLAMAAGKWMMGAWRNSGGEWGHLNGNCVLAAGVAGAVSGAIGEHLAWDCSISPWMRDHWFITERIHNCFQSTEANVEELFPLGITKSPRALVHGFKDGSLMDILWGVERAAEKRYGQSVAEILQKT